MFLFPFFFEDEVPDDHWSKRAPVLLLKAHVHTLLLGRLCGCLVPLLQALARAARANDDSKRGEVFRLIDAVAGYFAKFPSQLDDYHAWLAGVEEMFIVASDETVDCSWENRHGTKVTTQSLSHHHAVGDYTCAVRHLLLDAFDLCEPLKLFEDDVDRTSPEALEGTAEAVRAAFRAAVAELPEKIDTCLPVRNSIKEQAWFRRLEKEFFLAWKKEYPPGTEYETLSHDEAKRYAKELAQLQDPRPAYARDHLWLKWQREEGLTPAKIRDRWNAMTADERKDRCPLYWAPIGTAGKSNGRDTVKQALRTAEAEKERAAREH